MIKVLNLHMPDSYNCDLVYYKKTPHRVMCFKLYQTFASELTYLLFQHVQYFSGMTAWKGAAFMELSVAEKMAFLRKIWKEKKSIQQSSDDHILYTNFHVYTVEGVLPEIHIVAYNMIISETMEY